MLYQIPDPSLRVLAAWVPILPDDNEHAVIESQRLMPDARATHFWDAQRVLPDAFAATLNLPADWPAWDIYMAFAPGVQWPEGGGDETPPPPAFWYHQLGDLALAPRLDGAAFALDLGKLLDRA